MFGSSSNKPPPIGTSFGFGSNSQAPAAPTGATGGFGFGTSTAGGLTSAPTNSTSAPSLFGNKPGGLFGNSSSNTSAAGTLFGTNTTSTAPTTSLFGSTPQPSTQGTGLFGSTTTNPTTTGTTSLFNQPKQPTGSLFGSQPTTTTTNTLGGGLFGSQPAATSTFGGFGAQPQQPAFGLGQPQQLQQLQPQPQQPQVTDLIQQMAAFWNPANPQCQFKHYFYNMVHPSEVHLYQPSPNEDRTLYEQAQRENPDPSCMVPVLASGFDDIRKRITMQDQTCQLHKQKLSEILTSLESIQKRHFVDTVVKLEMYKRRQRQIAQKVFQLMKTVQLLRNRGYTIRAEEEALKSRLEMMERELQKPSVFRGRLNEIWAQLQQLNASRQFMQTSNAIGGAEDGGYGVSHEESLRPIYQTLAGLQEGLLHLTEVVRDDKQTVDTMLRAYSEAGYR